MLTPLYFDNYVYIIKYLNGHLNNYAELMFTAINIDKPNEILQSVQVTHKKIGKKEKTTEQKTII